MFKEGGIWPGKLSLWNLLCDKQHGRKSKTWLWFWLAALKEIGPLGRQKAAKWKPWHLEIVTPCSAVQAHRLLTWREGLHAAAGTRPKSRAGACSGAWTLSPAAVRSALSASRLAAGASLRAGRSSVLVPGWPARVGSQEVLLPPLGWRDLMSKQNRHWELIRCKCGNEGTFWSSKSHFYAGVTF